MKSTLQSAKISVSGLKATIKDFKARTSAMKFTKPELFEQHFDKSSQSTLLKVPFVPLYEVPFTPLCKHFTNGRRVPFGAPIQAFERDYIKIMRNMITKHHGPEALHYSQDDDDSKCATVDAWRNLYKMGREITPGYIQRLGEKFSEFEIGHTRFKPHWPSLTAAMDLLREELPKSLKVGPLKDIKSQPGFTKPNSNGGHPIYRNDRNLYHDKVKGETLPVKDFYLGLAREAITTALPDWEFSCPSIRLMRSQRSGIEDIDKSPDFKDSKSRNIIAYGRPECDSAGRFIGPMLDAMKASPCYINLWSRENREMVMRANSAVLDKLGLVSQNMDAKNFDLSVSPELIACIESLHLDSFAAGEDLIGMREMYQNLARKLVARWTGTQIEWLVSEFGLKSGGPPTSLVGTDISKLASIYGQIRLYGLSEVKRIRKALYEATGAYGSAQAGDDLWTWFKKMTDCASWAQIVYDELGIDYRDTVKGEYKMFFLQERTVAVDGGFKTYTPSPRMMSKCLWVERPKHLGWEQWVMATAAKMWNIKDNPELRDCVSLLKRFDKYKLGTMYEGDKISRNEFLAFIRASAAEEDNISTEAAVSDGNPAKDNLYDSDGMPSSAFINWWFDLVESIDEYSAEFDYMYQSLIHPGWKEKINLSKNKNEIKINGEEQIIYDY